MKIRSVMCNNRKKVFQVKASKGTLLFPYSKVEVRPSSSDPVVSVFVDKELGGEGSPMSWHPGRKVRFIASRCWNTIKPHPS